MDNTLLIIIGISALAIALILLKFLYLGAVNLFWWANESGFVGVAVYFACWICLFPFMIAGCIVYGVISWWGNR